MVGICKLSHHKNKSFLGCYYLYVYFFPEKAQTENRKGINQEEIQPGSKYTTQTEGLRGYYHKRYGLAMVEFFNT